MRPIDPTWWLRASAVTFAALAFAATAVEVNREGIGIVSQSARDGVSDPLAAELARCNAITPASPHDEACEQAWAQNRRRFLEAPSRSAVGPATAVPTPAASGDHP